MAFGPDAAIQILVAFTREAAGAMGPAEIWPKLANVLVDELEIGAAGVFQVQDGGQARLVASRNLPITELAVEAEAIGQELGERLLSAMGGDGGFARVATLPLVAGGDLIGSIAMLGKSSADPTPEQLRLADALADVAAIALANAHRYSDLARSYGELKASREILARTEKLRSLGQMAAGISHDLKSILNGLSLPLQAIKRELARKDPSLLDLIKSMEQTVTRGVDTVERLRDFSRQSPEQRPAPADLNALLREAVEICRPRLGMRGIAVSMHLGFPPPVMVQPSEFVTAAMNLLVNAIEALQGAGTITIETGTIDGGAFVRVSDDGPGMPPDIERRIFEPFFTTKGPKGTGLGLSMVYAFVRRHAGTIAVETEPGRGASFTLRFPPAAS